MRKKQALMTMINSTKIMGGESVKTFICDMDLKLKNYVNKTLELYRISESVTAVDALKKSRNDGSLEILKWKSLQI